MISIKKGDVYKISLGEYGVGSEQRGDRCAVIVQNNTGNKYSKTTIVALITSQTDKAKIPTHIEVNDSNSGVSKPSIVMCEQLRTVDKRRMGEYVGCLTPCKYGELNKALAISIGLPNPPVVT